MASQGPHGCCTMGILLDETPPAIVENRSGQIGDFFDPTAPKFGIHMPQFRDRTLTRDRKSTRLNSSHGYISYAVFCLKKKKNKHHAHHIDKTQIKSKAGMSQKSYGLLRDVTTNFTLVVHVTRTRNQNRV